jgi:hypothetical protein
LIHTTTTYIIVSIFLDEAAEGVTLARRPVNGLNIAGPEIVEPRQRGWLSNLSQRKIAGE